MLTVHGIYYINPSKPKVGLDPESEADICIW